jgi:hypothetical protein
MMRRRTASWFLLALLVHVGVLAALEWPLAPTRIAATFGTPARGRFVMGVAIAAEDELVRSMDSGDLAFSFEEGRHPSGLPSALGSFAIVEHARGLAAVYSHLAPGSLSTYLNTVKTGTILGKTGSSGWVEGMGTLFQIFDRREGRWVNPLVLMPPVDDTKAPFIRSLALVRNGKSYVLGDVPSVQQGSYTIAADIVDPADATWSSGPPAPYSIRLSVDGAELARYVFDVAEGRDGRLRLFFRSPKSYGEFRSRDGRYILAERLLHRGKTLIEVSAEDSAGNRRSASWSVVVE